MGFILEKYSENAAGLVVSFQQTSNSATFCATDSVEAAMEHFGLYKDESGNLKLKDANEEAMGDLGIKPDEADELRSTLDEITATMTDEEALEHKVLFKLWQPGLEYQKDEKCATGTTCISAFRLTHPRRIGCRPLCPRCGGRFPRRNIRNGRSLWGRMMRMAKATP